MAIQNRRIRYRAGYKYQLAQDYQILTQIKPSKTIITDYIRLSVDGLLTILTGYAWDGVSGTVRDSAKNMRASLVHDALYQLFRQQHLPAAINRQLADLLFRQILIEDGTAKILAQIYFWLLDKYAEDAASPSQIKTELTAP